MGVISHWAAKWTRSQQRKHYRIRPFHLTMPSTSAIRVNPCCSLVVWPFALWPFGPLPFGSFALSPSSVQGFHLACLVGVKAFFCLCSCVCLCFKVLGLCFWLFCCRFFVFGLGLVLLGPSGFLSLLCFSSSLLLSWSFSCLCMQLVLHLLFASSRTEATSTLPVSNCLRTWGRKPKPRPEAGGRRRSRDQFRDLEWLWPLPSSQRLAGCNYGHELSKLLSCARCSRIRNGVARAATSKA